MPRSTKTHTPTLLASILPRTLSALGIDQELSNRNVLRSWDTLVGDSLARHAHAVSIRNGVLYVNVTDSIWIQELTLMKPLVMRRLQQSFPASKITSIVLLNRGTSL